MKYIKYCDECVDDLSHLSPSYFNYWQIMVEGAIKGKMVEFDLDHPNNSYSRRLLHDMEINGFIVTAEISTHHVRIKPNGINRKKKGNDEIISVCLNELLHEESYEFDENLIED